MGISALSSVTIAGLRLPTAVESGNTGTASATSKTYLRPGKLPYTPLFIDIKDKANDVSNAENSTAETRATAYSTTDAYDVSALHLSPTPDGLRRDRTTSAGTTTTILKPLASDTTPSNVVAGRVQTVSRTVSDAGLPSATESTNTSVTETLADVDVMTLTYATASSPATTNDLVEADDDAFNTGNPGIGVVGESIALKGAHALPTTQIVAVSGTLNLPAIAFVPDVHESSSLTTLLSSPSAGGSTVVAGINTPAPTPDPRLNGRGNIAVESSPKPHQFGAIGAVDKDRDDELLRIRPDRERISRQANNRDDQPIEPGILERFRRNVLERLRDPQHAGFGVSVRV